MNTSLLIAAFSVGIIGSFHCIGMCGAIALSLPIANDRPLARFGGGLLYNLGRLTTYGFLGLLLGIVGRGVSLAGFQQTLSIVIGISLIIYLIAPHLLKKTTSKNPSSWWSRTQLSIRNQMGKLFKNSSPIALFGIGILNGLLPCGLVYVAMAGAIATGYGLGGAIYMISFGVGTLPLMLLATQFRGLISISVRNKMRQAAPIFVGIMGILFIVRGLSLGIPYLSPILEHQITSWMMPANCH
jgi:sulfite exporter TauE/SafE